MRMWEPGDPIEGGNATGIPDVDYFDYLKINYDDDDYRNYRNDNNRNYEDYNSSNQDNRDYEPKERSYTFDELLKIARESFDRANYSEALDYYNQALDWHYDEEAKCGKAECLRKLGRNNEASQLFFELGDYYTWGSADKNVAVEYYKKSIECNPNNDDALDNLGYALRGLKRYDEALTYYGRVKHKDVDWPMAMCYMELKRYRNAIPLLDKVIRECPHCDDHLDQKCECLIGLNRKGEAVKLWKQFIDFLMEKECYERALERLDLLSQNTNNEDIFINDRREKCLKEKESLEIRFRAILKVMSSYHMYNPNGLDENDLYGFMKFVCEESGESVDDIVRWYETPMLGSSSFKAICGDCLHYSHWDKIVDMYEKGKFRDL